MYLCVCVCIQTRIFVYSSLSIYAKIHISRTVLIQYHMVHPSLLPFHSCISFSTVRKQTSIILNMLSLQSASLFGTKVLLVPPDP